MKIESFGGFVKTETLPRRTKNTQPNALVDAILAKLVNINPGFSLPVNVTEFGPYDRYQLQKKLQSRGAKVTVSIHGVRDKDGNLTPAVRDKDGVVKSGVVCINRMSDQEWAEYIKRPSAQPAKKK